MKWKLTIIMMVLIMSVKLVGAPVFVDDTDTDWDAGTLFGFIISGTGAEANLTSANNSGHFTSQIFDAGENVNWSNITAKTDAQYGKEIGRGANIRPLSAPLL